MIITLSLMILITFIPVLMFSFNMILSKKIKINHEKTTPFECGFDPMSTNRLPFSVQFFMVSLIFLIFDVEISLLIPLIQMLTYYNPTIIILSLIFMLTLILSLYFEYLENSIEWKK